MPCPFPGMDPYLEHPTLWPGVHNGLLAALQLALAPQLRPRYYIALEERVYVTEPEQRTLIGRPDLAVVGPTEAESVLQPAPAGSAVLTVRVPLPDEMRENYLEVRETGTDYVIAVMEMLSPTNKRPGRGRRIYEDERLDVLATRLARELGGDRWVSPETRRRELQLRIHAFIQEHLGDPELSPAAIAAANHISLRLLHKLFQEQGQTVAGWIRARRLERCRRDLLDPAQAACPVAAVAARWGFRSAIHFSRLFRATYGLPPHEYRLCHSGSGTQNAQAGSEMTGDGTSAGA